MPFIEVDAIKKSHQVEQCNLLRQIQSTLDNCNQTIFKKNYQQWIHKIVPLKSIAVILFDPIKKHHVFYDVFPDDFQQKVNQQLEDGIIPWAGQQKELFLSEQKIFLPLHCRSNYIGIIEIVPKKKKYVLNDDTKVMLEIVSDLIANHFYNIQLNHKANIIHNDEHLQLALLGAISNGIIHEISNPLTTIVGRSGILLSRQNKLQSNLAIIEREAARVSSIIHEFLAISKNHFEKEAVQEIYLNDVIKKSIFLLSNYAKLKHVKLQANFQCNGKVAVKYYNFLTSLIKIIFFELTLVKKPQTIKICTFSNNENVCIEIDNHIPDGLSFDQFLEYPVEQKNGKILLQLPVLLEIEKNITEENVK